MKRGINKVTLMGNVGDDPKVNQINDTMKVARFPLATNEVYLDKEGNQVQKTEWHQVVFWNKAADIVETYVVDSARLDFRYWECTYSKSAPS